MEYWETELRSTLEKIQDAKDLTASRIQYRDRQIRAAVADGHTWRQLQSITGLSPRGFALAIKRV